ncbi:mercuric transport protein MerTP [uncultured Pontibacter sp.]|uniref:mercuric transport protein MerTP n=1 Tax=uncultured Pontibacter sp. TaxID=453356 RepID=UPI00262738AB|nr:mercuric transport protein MerTP [uncultured Pontibacter sp.]
MKSQKIPSTNRGETPAAKVWLGTGLVSAVAASLCCIAPMLAIVAGTSSMAASLSWLEPLRPYLIGLTALALGFAWYQRLKPTSKIACDCETNSKPNFMQTKTFLSIITVFAAVMLAFPSYAHVFYPQTQGQQTTADKANVQTVEVKIKGMTCAGCEGHVNSEVNKLAGILKVKTSYADGNTLVQFDKTKTDVKQIEKAVLATGYEVTETKKK